jgi:phage-related protein
MKWTIEFYSGSDGREPAVIFLNSLPAKTRAKVTRILNLLGELGVLLKEPYTKQVRGKIRELRVSDEIGAVRVLYFSFTGRRLILLHGFVKKTDKIPKKEIDIAERRMEDFLKRQGGKP